MQGSWGYSEELKLWIPCDKSSMDGSSMDETWRYSKELKLWIPCDKSTRHEMDPAHLIAFSNKKVLNVETQEVTDLGKEHHCTKTTSYPY